MKFQNKIKRLRTQNKYTQQYVADYLHVTRKAVSNWENGRSIPNINILIDLGKLYDDDLTNYSYGTSKHINNDIKYDNNKYMIKSSDILIYINAVTTIVCLINIKYPFLTNFYFGAQLLIDTIIFIKFNNKIIKEVKNKKGFILPLIIFFVIIFISQMGKSINDIINEQFLLSYFALVIASILHSIVVLYGLSALLIIKVK